MIKYSNYAVAQLQDLVLKYCGYHYGAEFGTSAFWNWFYQVKNYAYSLDAVCEQECEYGVYTMPYWGKVVYSCHFVDDECMVYVHEFKFNKKNFMAWLHHQELCEQRIRRIVNDVIIRRLYLI